ncbi:MAG: hypothetical protein FJ122_12240 [Deltaproteobacteria bacterium]|nr:hypothetical protein [Deltaproteobacteria bacterium]
MKKIQPMGRKGDLNSRIHQKEFGGAVGFELQLFEQTGKSLIFTKARKRHRIDRKSISGIAVLHPLIPFGDENRLQTITG